MNRSQVSKSALLMLAVTLGAGALQRASGDTINPEYCNDNPYDASCSGVVSTSGGPQSNGGYSNTCSRGTWEPGLGMCVISYGQVCATDSASGTKSCESSVDMYLPDGRVATINNGGIRRSPTGGCISAFTGRPVPCQTEGNSPGTQPSLCPDGQVLALSPASVYGITSAIWACQRSVAQSCKQDEHYDSTFNVCTGEVLTGTAVGKFPKNLTMSELNGIVSVGLQAFRESRQNSPSGYASAFLAARQALAREGYDPAATLIYAREIFDKIMKGIEDYAPKVGTRSAKTNTILITDEPLAPVMSDADKVKALRNGSVPLMLPVKPNETPIEHTLRLDQESYLRASMIANITGDPHDKLLAENAYQRYQHDLETANGPAAGDGIDFEARAIAASVRGAIVSLSGGAPDEELVAKWVELLRAHHVVKDDVRSAIADPASFGITPPGSGAAAIPVAPAAQPTTGASIVDTITQWFSGQPSTDPRKANCDAQVTKAYADGLGRTPEAGELASWSNACLSGAAIESAIRNSTEGTCRAGVIDAYLTILLRTASEPEIRFQTNACTNGMPINTIRQSFLNSPEGQSKVEPRCRAGIANAYKTLLLRDASQGELDWRTGLCVNGMSVEAQSNDLRNSPEYASKH